MTRDHYFRTKLRTGLPSAVAGLAAFGAMTLVRREWAAQVGLLVYFPVLVLMTDGIDIFDRERLKRFFEGLEQIARAEKACLSFGRDQIAALSSRDPIGIRANHANPPSILVDERVSGEVVVDLYHIEIG